MAQSTQSHEKLTTWEGGIDSHLKEFLKENDTSNKDLSRILCLLDLEGFDMHMAVNLLILHKVMEW